MVVIVAVAGIVFRIIEIHDEPDFFAEVVVKAGLAFFKHALHRPAKVVGHIQERLAGSGRTLTG